MFDGARRWRAYALSKFATALLARHLNGRQGVRAVAVHPGAVRTQMAQGVGTARTRKFLFFFKHMLIEPVRSGSGRDRNGDPKAQKGQSHIQNPKLNQVRAVFAVHAN